MITAVKAMSIVKKIISILVITLSVFSFFIGCEDKYTLPPVLFELDARLPIDENG